MKKIFIFLTISVFLSVKALSQTAFADEIREFEQQDSANAPIQRGQILLYGSSTIRLWKESEQDFAFKQLKVINRGFGGSQAHHAILYFDRVVLPHRPSWIFFYEGDNDINADKSVEETFQDYMIFINMVKKQLPNTRVVIFSIKHSPSRIKHFDKQKKLNSLLKAYCSKQRNVYFLDTASPMLNTEGVPDPKYFVQDMLHMNREGYLLWTSVVRQFYKKLK
jgi:lysophospholipase L1-like esterase